MWKPYLEKRIYIFFPIFQKTMKQKKVHDEERNYMANNVNMEFKMSIPIVKLL
jgi:hypothetical protein